MERYTRFGNEIIDQSTGKKRISTVSYPFLPYRDSDIYVYSKSGDRLDILAFDYYQDQTMWWIIARVNNLGKGSFNVPPGRRLRIPYPIDDIDIALLLTNEI
jgi:hypothetical protein